MGIALRIPLGDAKRNTLGVNVTQTSEVYECASPTGMPARSYLWGEPQRFSHREASHSRSVQLLSKYAKMLRGYSPSGNSMTGRGSLYLFINTCHNNPLYEEALCQEEDDQGDDQGHK